VGDVPVPKFGSEATNGEMTRGEQLSPGNSCGRQGMYRASYRWKEAGPRGARRIASTYGEQAGRATSGTLQGRAASALQRGQRAKGEGQAGCPGGGPEPPPAERRAP
jgi:transposase InsO family protein